MTSVKVHFRSLTAYDLHKRLINDYVLNTAGATKLLKRDTSRDKRDIDVIEENHRFLWEDDQPKTWEEQLAKKYYDKLFKEYCICDLSRYKDNAVALRWRTEQEVVIGRGQFSCGNKKCTQKTDLRTWEVNFAYQEQGTKKNALVKLRLCPECSTKLNYRSKKREVKRLKSKRRRYSSSPEVVSDQQEVASTSALPDGDKNDSFVTEAPTNAEDEETIWSKPREEEVHKSRDDEFEEYLQQLLL